MPKKPRRNRRPEILNRTVEITSFGTSLRVGVDEPKDPEPEIEVKPWLRTRRAADLPAGGVGASSKRSTAARLLPGTRCPYTSTVTVIEPCPSWSRM